MSQGNLWIFCVSGWAANMVIVFFRSLLTGYLVRENEVRLNREMAKILVPFWCVLDLVFKTTVIFIIMLVFTILFFLVSQ